MLRLAPLLLLPIALAACTTPHDERRRELAELSARHDREQLEFQAARREFAGRHAMPMHTAFPTLGTIVVHECALIGHADAPLLRLQFSWVNDTGGGSDGVRVRVLLRGPGGGAEHEQELVLRPLLGGRFGLGSSYTTYVEIPTLGLHRQPGWSWRIDLAPLEPARGDAAR